MLITDMQEECSTKLPPPPKPPTIKIEVIIMICMFKVIHHCYQIYLRILNKCIEIYELDPAHFLSAPGLACQACFKKSEVKLELLTYVDMLLMVEKGIRGGICQATHRYAKANNKYMKNHDKNKESSYIQYYDASILFMLKQKIFMKIFRMMLKKGLIHQIIKSKDHYLQERIKKWYG